MLKNYLKTAWRNLLRNRLVSFITIAGFSTGLAFVLLITVFIKNEYSYDQFHKSKDNIYRITGTGTDDRGNIFRAGNTKAILAPLFVQRVPAIKNFCRLDGGTLLVKKNNDVISQTVIQVDSSFFSMFSFPLLQGDPATVLHAPEEAVVTDETALKIFGHTDVVGKVIEIEMEGKFIPFRISAVAKKAPYNSTIYFDVAVPFNNASSPKTPEALQSSWVNTFVTTNEQANIPAIETAITNNYRAYTGSLQNKPLINFSYGLQPITGMHLNEDFNVFNGLRNGSSKTYSYVLTAIAIFILLIVCINFINLVLARSMQRAKEIGIRKVTGSTKRQLIFQFLTESVLITILSIIPATGIIILLLPYFSAFVKMDIHPLAILDSPAIILAAGLILFTGILAGSYPALVLSSCKPVQALAGKIKLSGKNFLNRGLIIFQFTVAVFLIICTITMKEQFIFLSARNLGYRTDNISVVQVPRKIQKKLLPLLQNELNKLPGVMQTTITNWGQNMTKFTVEGNTIDWCYYQPVDEHFTEFFGIRLLEGRNFYASGISDSSNCLVTQAFLRSMGWQNAVGKQIGYGKRTLTITGVTADYNIASLKQKIKPIVLMKRDSAQPGQLYIHYMPGLFATVKAAVHKIVKEIDPLHKEEITELQDYNAEKYSEEKSWAAIVNFSALTCILLSCLGLFGLSHLNISQRVKEISIRKVLGANATGIVVLMSNEFLKLVLIASVLAFPAGWWAMNKWLQDFAYRIAIHWWFFAMAGSVAVFIALLATGFQATKAALANPVNGLRTE